MNERCPNCGWMNPKGARKCASCMADLTPQQEGPFDAEELAARGETPRTGQPGYPGPAPYDAYGLEGQSDAPNYMAWAVVMTVLSALCCSVFSLVPAVVGLVFSSTANSRRVIGDYAGAADYSAKARFWLILATVLLVIGIVVGIIWGILGAMRGMMHSPGFPTRVM